MAGARGTLPPVGAETFCPASLPPISARRSSFCFCAAIDAALSATEPLPSPSDSIGAYSAPDTGAASTAEAEAAFSGRLVPPPLAALAAEAVAAFSGRLVPPSDDGGVFSGRLPPFPPRSFSYAWSAARRSCADCSARREAASLPRLLHAPATRPSVRL